MSTDYGLRCSDCGAIWIDDNVTQVNAIHIQKDLHDLARLHEIKGTLLSDIYFSAHFRDLFGLMEFASIHHEHTVIVIDEYQYTDFAMEIWEKSKQDQP